MLFAAGLAANVVFGLLSAASWGVGDFAGGTAVRSSGGEMGGALRVVVFGHLSSLVTLASIALLLGQPFPHGASLLWGISAGVVAGISLVAFYIALSRPAMGVSAALSGLLAAAIPALLSRFVEGAPGARTTAGFLIAGVAIWLIAMGDAEREDRATMFLAIASGTGFGVYFAMLKFAATAGLVWPTATARMGSISICTLILLLRRRSHHRAVGFGAGTVAWMLTGAAFDTGGNLAYTAATRAGRLDIAAVLASLYPAGTILLAAWRDHERPTARQGWGMAVAALAVVLIAL